MILVCIQRKTQIDKEHKMSQANAQFEWLKDLDLHKKVVTATYTVRTGTPTYDGLIDNPVDVDDPAADFTLTVPDGSKMGQMLLIVMSSNGSSKECSASISHHETSDPEILYLNAADEYILLVWTGTEWATVSTTASTSSGG
jgi:hypothetical protein